MLVDSHCHLDYFTPAELPDVLARAAAAGVGEMVTIGTTLAQSERLPPMIEEHPNLWCTIGVHPHHAAEAPIPTPETLAAMVDHPRVIGIGKSGLDYFYDKSPRDVQAENFRAHIRGARLAGVPLCIHARDADDDIALILKQEQDNGGKFDFLLHCFSSGRGLAEAALAMGGYVSFSGILTFPRSEELRENRPRRAARPAAGGDRCAISRAGAVPRQAQRAGLGGPHRQGARRTPGDDAGSRWPT